MNDLIVNLLVIATMTVPISEWITKKTHVSGKLAQLQAWLVAVVITLAANMLGIGRIGEMRVFGAIMFGGAAGLMANGVFDLDFVKKVLAWIGLRVKDAVEQINS
jgi:hypothetical protein